MRNKFDQKHRFGDNMRQILEIEDEFRLIPADTEIYNGGHTIIKTIEDTVMAKILYKERSTSEVKKELAFALAGKIGIIVDAILVTSKGATGRSIEKIVESAAIKATDFIDFDSLDKNKAPSISGIIYIVIKMLCGISKK